MVQKTRTQKLGWIAIAFFAAALLLIVDLASAQHVPTAKLDELLDTLAAQNKAMGSLAICKNGKIIYSKAFGYSYIGNNKRIPANTHTKYRIASISKMFTSTMIFQLLEEGRINLSTTLNNYFPEIPNPNIITIGDMLAHKSGIHDFTKPGELIVPTDTIAKPHGMADKISKYKPDFLPGEKFEYSNSNYLLLGYIIEKLDGGSYAESLQKRINSRIDLQETDFGKGTPDQSKNESFSYKFNKKWEHEAEVSLTDHPGGAGGIVSTPSDLALYIDALFNLKLVSENSLNYMLPNGEDHYGMGMHSVPYYATKGFGHSGAIDASRSLLIFFPEDSLSIAYCTNGHLYMMEEIVNQVLKIYYNKPYQIPVRKRSIKLSKETLERYVGTYEIRPQLRVSITLEDDVLFAQTPRGDKIELFAKSKNTFFSMVDEVELKFIKKKQKKCDTLIIIDGDNLTKARRIFDS